MNKNIIINLCILLILLPLKILGQQTEAAVIERLENISKEINPNADISIQLNYLKEVTTKNKGNLSLTAVANTLSGKLLSQKNYHEEALPFLKKAYKYRKKLKKPIPQKWALQSLIDNGKKRQDYKAVAKYVEFWIKLIEDNKNEDVINKDIDTEFDLLLEHLSPTKYLNYQFIKESTTDKLWQERRELGHQLIKKSIKKYSKFRSYFFVSSPKNRLNYYSYLVEFALYAGNIEQARHWEKKGLKSIKKYRTKSEQANHLRYFITLYNTEEHYFEVSPHEAEAIRLMKVYIKMCKKTGEHNNVTFGYRYLSKRQRVQKNYTLAIQALAEATKYSRKYNLSDIEIEKAYKGLYPIINKMNYKGDKKERSACKNWKSKYSLKGLTNKDIERFDEIISDIRE